MHKIALFLLLSCFGTHAQQPLEQGKDLFSKNCTMCHGKSGKKGFFGAKDLTKTALTEAGYFSIISSGRGNMPRWADRLTETEIKSVVRYVKTFRKP